MKIDSLSLLNIDVLYDILSEIDNNDTNVLDGVRLLGSNAYNIYSHCAVTFQVSEISIIDYFYLKKMSNEISNFIRDIEFNSEYFLSNYNVINKSTIEFLDKKMASDVDAMFFISNILPAGFNLGKCSITFSGNGLYVFFDSGAKKFFFDADNNCISDKKLRLDYKISEENLTNQFCSTFINQFYKYMLNDYEKMDLVSLKYEDRYFNNHASTKPILISLRAPICSINFLQDESADISKKVNRLTNYINNDTSKSYLDDISVEFLCNTTFGTFLELFNMLDSALFINIEPIQRVRAKPFSVASYGWIDDNIKWINSINKDIFLDIRNIDKTGILNIEMVHMSSPIKFTLKMSLSDVNMTSNLKYDTTKSFTILRAKEFMGKLYDITRSISSIIRIR